MFLGIKYDMKNLSPSQQPILSRRSDLAEVFTLLHLPDCRPDYRFRICCWINVPKTKTNLELRIQFWCCCIVVLVRINKPKQTEANPRLGEVFGGEVKFTGSSVVKGAPCNNN